MLLDYIIIRQTKVVNHLLLVHEAVTLFHEDVEVKVDGLKLRKAALVQEPLRDLLEVAVLRDVLRHHLALYPVPERNVRGLWDARMWSLLKAEDVKKLGRGWHPEAGMSHCYRSL